MPVFAKLARAQFLSILLNRLHTEGVTLDVRRPASLNCVTDGPHGFSFGVLREHQLHELARYRVYDVLALLVHLLRLEARTPYGH